MSEHSRREFLGLSLPAAVAVGAGLAALRPSAVSAAQGPPPAASAGRNYGASRFALELDGLHAGWLESVEGGDATSDVITDNQLRKHLAGVKYEDIVLTCGTGMSRAFYEWIKASFDKKPMAKNGAIVASDFNGRPVSRLNWTNGILTEIALPALDVASKNPANMTVRITPSLTQITAAQSTAPSATLPAVQKKWLPSAFRLQIAGCLTACSRVNAIDAIVLKSAQAAGPLGVTRAIKVAPGPLDVSNLSLTTPEMDAGEFFSWYQDFLIKGRNTPDKEKTGTLEYLIADGASLKPFITLNFAGLGIFKFAPEKAQASVQTIRRVKAEMYCDSIGFAAV